MFQPTRLRALPFALTLLTVSALPAADTRRRPPAPRAKAASLTPPVPAEPGLAVLLQHLQRLSVQKDFREFASVTPSDLTGLFGNTWWFHNHSGALGLVLTEEEIRDLGVQEVADLGYLATGVSARSLQEEAGGPGALPVYDPLAKHDPQMIDKLPPETDPVHGKDFAVISGPLHRATYQAGLYRLFKAIPAPLWDELQIRQVRPNPQKPAETHFNLAVKEKPIVEMTVRREADGRLALIYIHYLVWPKALADMAARLPAKGR